MPVRPTIESKIEALGARATRRNTGIAMDALRTRPDDTPVDHLSGGEVRRAAVARLLMDKPDVLPPHGLEGQGSESAVLQTHRRQRRLYPL